VLGEARKSMRKTIVMDMSQDPEMMQEAISNYHRELLISNDNRRSDNQP